MRRVLESSPSSWQARTASLRSPKAGVALASTRGVDAFGYPPLDAQELEPTGAGDVFAASFLVALGEGQEPLDAAQFAACAASFAVEAPGVAGVFENRAEVEARLADYRTRYHPKEIEP